MKVKGSKSSILLSAMVAMMMLGSSCAKIRGDAESSGGAIFAAGAYSTTGEGGEATTDSRLVDVTPDDQFEGLSSFKVQFALPEDGLNAETCQETLEALGALLYGNTAEATASTQLEDRETVALVNEFSRGLRVERMDCHVPQASFYDREYCRDRFSNERESPNRPNRSAGNGGPANSINTGENGRSGIFMTISSGGSAPVQTAGGGTNYVVNENASQGEVVLGLNEPTTQVAERAFMECSIDVSHPLHGDLEDELIWIHLLVRNDSGLIVGKINKEFRYQRDSIACTDYDPDLSNFTQDTGNENNGRMIAIDTEPTQVDGDDDEDSSDDSGGQTGNVNSPISVQGGGTTFHFGGN